MAFEAAFSSESNRRIVGESSIRAII